MKPLRKAFIDANILQTAALYEKSDVYDWIDALYDTIYIHISVFQECLHSQVRRKIEDRLQSSRWILFDPDQSEELTDEQYVIYEQYRQFIGNGFRRLSARKRAEGKEAKLTRNVGEIDSLAAALLLSVDYICSNDYEIREVIESEQLQIAPEEDESPRSIIQDTFEDVCLKAVWEGIASRKEVRKFYSFVNGQDPEWKRKNKLTRFDQRLLES